MIRATVLLVALFAVAVVLAGWVYGDLDRTARTAARIELFSALAQLAVVAVIGSGITVVLQAIERGRGAARTRAVLRRDYAGRLGAAYRAAKEARRLLRAHGLTDAYNNPPGTLTPGQVDAYDHCLTLVNRAQLDLEALRIEADHSLILTNRAALVATLSTMEKYLGKIVSEYERRRSAATIQFTQLGDLREFTQRVHGPAKLTAPFHRDFAGLHEQAIALIVGENP